LKQVETALSDADITVKVELALMKRDGLNNSNISLTIQERVVTLTGLVSDAAQSRLETDLSRAAEDVKRVDNYLSIVSAPQ
jgi:osmotically-inducible protein OsmY